MPEGRAAAALGPKKAAAATGAADYALGFPVNAL